MESDLSPDLLAQGHSLTQVLQGLKDSRQVLVRQQVVKGQRGSLVQLVFFSNLPAQSLKACANGSDFCTIILLPQGVASPQCLGDERCWLKTTRSTLRAGTCIYLHQVNIPREFTRWTRQLATKAPLRFQETANWSF